jgi:hypothetical protein
MERQYEERLAALLAERGGGIGGEGAGAPGHGAAGHGQNSDRSMPPQAAQPPSAFRKQQQLGQGSCLLSGMQQARQQAETTEQQQQQQLEELQAALAAETARVEADVERVAVEQALASSGIATRSRKKPRKEGISQVWEWLEGGSGPGEAGAAQQQQQLAPPPQQAPGDWHGLSSAALHFCRPP